MNTTPKVLTAPKNAFVKVLRSKADEVEKGGTPISGQQDLFRPNTTSPDPNMANFCRWRADVLEKAPGKTTEEVYEKASGKVEKAKRFVEKLAVAGPILALAGGLATAVLCAGPALLGVGLGVAVGFGTMATTEGAIHRVIDKHQENVDQLNAIGVSKNRDEISFGEKALLKEANQMDGAGQQWMLADRKAS